MTNIVQIPGFDGDYLASDKGEIISLKRNCPKYLRLHPDKRGYLRVHLSFKGSYKYYSVHRLIMKSFKPKHFSEDLQVNHINGIKNDNRLINLEMVTNYQNIRHFWDTNGVRRDKSGEDHHNSLFSNEQVAIIRRYYRDNEISQRALAKILCTSQVTVGKLLTGQTYKGVAL